MIFKLTAQRPPVLAGWLAVGDCYFLSLASRMPGTLPIADKAQHLRMSIAEHYRCRRDEPTSTNCCGRGG